MPELPSVPVIATALLDDHRVAHRARRSALDDLAAPARRVHQLLEERLLVESLGNVQPVRPALVDQLLVPPPRAFLTAEDELRLAGARAALRYVRARIDARGADRGLPTLVPSSPYVLHSCFEAQMPSGTDRRAGVERAEGMVLTARSHPAPLAPPADCARLLDLAMATTGAMRSTEAMGSTGSEPSVVRAGWLAFAVLSIHPFRDGNGRVARALYLAEQSDQVEAGLDGGALEQLAHNHAGHLAALDEGWSHCTSWDPARLDARPFVEVLVHASILGAHLSVERARWISARLGALHGRVASEQLAAAVLLVAIWRGLAAVEVAELGDPAIRSGVDEAFEAGLIAVGPMPPSRRPRRADRTLGFHLTDRGTAMLG